MPRLWIINGIRRTVASILAMIFDQFASGEKNRWTGGKNRLKVTFVIRIVRDGLEIRVFKKFNFFYFYLIFFNIFQLF
jgi:hypothetical protein